MCDARSGGGSWRQGGGSSSTPHTTKHDNETTTTTTPHTQTQHTTNQKVAGSPELYPVLVDGPALPALLQLLGHDNADLAAEAVDALQEMTDAGA